MNLGKKVLITGSQSGLGQFLSEKIKDCVMLTRLNKEEVLKDSVDVIIHCAFDSSRKIVDHYKYVDDNILLTKDLTKIPHKKFVYISSLEVYQQKDSFYKFSKILAESIVTEKGCNPLILRCSSLLGTTMRSNTFNKLCSFRNSKVYGPYLSLRENSEFNFIRHQDVFDSIISLINSDAEGIIDCCSQTTITLKEVANQIGALPYYGPHIYKVPRRKGCIDKTSKEAIEAYLHG
jgi:nucleoside-diphosphate-sugar epimerase